MQKYYYAVYSYGLKMQGYMRTVFSCYHGHRNAGVLYPVAVTAINMHRGTLSGCYHGHRKAEVFNSVSDSTYPRNYPGNARVSSSGVFCDVALEIMGTFLQF